MSRPILLFCLLASVMVGCSRDPERGSANGPTSPSAVTASLLGASAVAPGGISGPMDVNFPGRNDTFDFRLQLDAKYERGLGRSASATFVDREGDVVWTQEYIRYRVNGCDHATAVQRVFAQIDGNTPGQLCGSTPTGEIAFPSRADTLDFRRQLESKYQQMGRSLSASFVDIEGAVIWTQEYLRYRLNSCEHTQSIQKVFSQIDGGGVAATCYVPPEPCNYRLTPGSQNVSGAAGTFEIEFFRVSGNCTWTVTSNQSWLTITPPTSGEGPTRVEYRVAANLTNSPRAAIVRFDWDGGSTNHLVFQSGSVLALSITLTDPFRSSTSPTDACHIKSTNTPCTLTASANITGPSTFTWKVEYLYPNLITHNQTGQSNVFTFTQQCGGGSSTAEGTPVTMTVTLTVTDPNGATQTIVQTFVIVLYIC